MYQGPKVRIHENEMENVSKIGMYVYNVFKKPKKVSINWGI